MKSVRFDKFGGGIEGNFGGPLPKSGVSARLAISHDAFVDDENVRLYIRVLHHFPLFAASALEKQTASILFLFGNGSEIDAPEVEIGWVHEGYAVSVRLTFRTDAAYDAD
jgi:hypothetical protein